MNTLGLFFPLAFFLIVVSGDLPDRCHIPKTYNIGVNQIDYNNESQQMPTVYAPVGDDLHALYDEYKTILRNSYDLTNAVSGISKAWTEGTLILTQTVGKCKFRFTEPEFAGSVSVLNAGATYERTFGSVSTYSASESYNWNVKVSAKFSPIEKVLEIGGEASGGGSYTCTYTTAKTKTLKISCTTKKDSGTLAFYSTVADNQCKTQARIFSKPSCRIWNAGPQPENGSPLLGIMDVIIDKYEYGQPNWYAFNPDRWHSDYTLDWLRNESRFKDKENIFMTYTPWDNSIIFYHDCRWETTKDLDDIVVPFTLKDGNAAYSAFCIMT